MRFGITLLSCLFLSGLLHAQAPQCSGCPNPAASSRLQGHVVCHSDRELTVPISTRKPVAPPGLNEHHMNIDGTVATCLCFARTGRVTDLSILSGPAIMQQSVLDSVKDWTFRPIMRAGRRYGDCGILRLHVVLNDSQVRMTIEKW
jgi:hypothetical protein